MNDDLMKVFFRRHKKAVTAVSIALLLLFFLVLASDLYFQSMTYQRQRFLQEVGVALPTSSANFHSARKAGFDGGEYWAAAELPHNDFLKLANALHLSQDAATLDYYREALNQFRNPDISSWWCKKREADGETWIAANPDGFIVMTYENGRFFLRRSRY